MAGKRTARNPPDALLDEAGRLRFRTLACPTRTLSLYTPVLAREGGPSTSLLKSETVAASRFHERQRRYVNGGAGAADSVSAFATNSA